MNREQNDKTHDLQILLQEENFSWKIETLNKLVSLIFSFFISKMPDDTYFVVSVQI